MSTKFFAVALLVASFSFAQTRSQATLTPFGPWGLCGHGIAANSWMCVGYEQQVGNYQLAIHGSSNLATAYRYTISATMADGTVKAVSALVDRKDNPEGFTNIQPIAFGGIITAWQIRIDELATVASVQHPRVTK